MQVWEGEEQGLDELLLVYADAVDVDSRCEPASGGHGALPYLRGRIEA
jgi:hypothetical protein